ncbi:MAG: LPS export ABC transporter periplasmic protein LptC [Nitrospirae bacterium]|nr:LPS export ABC transporter periplasmic protein LptC [Nitrospirota bacterium]
MLPIRRLLLVFLLLLLITIGTFLYLRPPSRGGAEESLAPLPAPQVMKGFQITQAESGDVRWDLEAQEVEIVPEGNRALLRRLRMVFALPDGKRVTVKGAEGWVDLATRDVTVRQPEGETILVSNEGHRLETRQLHWRNQARTITTEGAFRFSSPTLVVEGRGMVVYPDLQRLEVMRDVKTTWLP